MRLFGVSMFRNEGDIVRLNILYHLASGVDCMLVIDNGSTDDTTEELRRLGRNRRVKWRREGSPYHKEEMITEMAREAVRMGAVWVVMIDADEFYWTPHGDLRVPLARCVAQEVRVAHRTYIQRRSQLTNTPDGLLHMTRRVAQPVGGSPEERQRLVTSGQAAYVELTPSAKWIRRARSDIRIDAGNHIPQGSEELIAQTEEIVLLHAALRSRETLEAKALSARRRDEAGWPEGWGWHSRYWLRKLEEGYLDEEWWANSYEADHIDVYGRRQRVVYDPTLRAAIAPWVDRTSVGGDLRRDPHQRWVSVERPVGFVACQSPNQHARPASLEIREGAVVFHGYQEFEATRGTVRVLPEDGLLERKRQVLVPFFSPGYLSRREVLDLGANGGFFCFWALQSGAGGAVAVEMDEHYVTMLERARAHLGVENLEVVKGRVSECRRPGDVVLALALVHWVYSCTEAFGSIDAVVRHLAALTNYMLIVEWVDPDDPAVAFFHHIDWNREIAREPYTLEAFEAALRRHFARVEHIGDVSPTRRLYVAFRTRYEVDLSGPLPLLMEKERLISCRRLATWNGVDYWSCVYDDGDVVQKQATLDLAEREAYFLRQLSGPYFPRVLDAKSEGEYSIVTLEKVPGALLRERMRVDIATPAEFHAFVQHCLNVLRELRGRAILHRDIRPDNMLLHEGRPVLIDFGWAVSPQCPYFTPPGLGDCERPPDGSFCDVYSMGKVLDQVNGERFPEFDGVISLMTQADPTLRVTDIDLLERLFTIVANRSGLSGR